MFFVSGLNHVRDLKVASRSDSLINLKWTEPEKGGGAACVKNYAITWTFDKVSGNLSTMDNSTNQELSLKSNTLFMISVVAVGDNEINGIASDSLEGITCW